MSHSKHDILEENLLLKRVLIGKNTLKFYLLNTCNRRKVVKCVSMVRELLDFWRIRPHIELRIGLLDHKEEPMLAYVLPNLLRLGTRLPLTRSILASSDRNSWKVELISDNHVAIEPNFVPILEA